ncbi:XkdW family protein [Paenibacillus sp. FSL H3-0310]|uniref:XkdW family protein n=1 Tax=Paenibacillus sp. FSL H3-0310 TaxID=2921429 RepID=UPI0030FC2B85
MNIADAIIFIYPEAIPLRDFVIQNNGPEPVLRPGAEVKGRVLYEIKQPEKEEQTVEGVHYRYGIDYNLLTEGEDYDLLERGPHIAMWNLNAPQPTEAELQAAWTAYQEAEANKPPELTETEQLRADNAALLLELVQTQARQDQAEQDQAALLLSLVEGGVL